MFAVVDYDTGYEFCGVETGGRQWALEVYHADASMFTFPKHSIVAIVHTVESGQNGIILHANHSSGIFW
jgi:hypothetical protein